MPGHQRIFVVSTAAGEEEATRVRDDLGRRPTVIGAPTGEAERVLGVLDVESEAEPLLAPVRFPAADRGHLLDALVRRHALRDRFRDVVVVTDPATSTLLLRALAPDQLPSGGAVTVVGLARGDRPVSARRAAAGGLVLGLAALVAQPLTSVLVLVGLVAALGVVLLLARPWQHIGKELLLAAAVAATVFVVGVAGSARFPGRW